MSNTLKMTLFVLEAEVEAFLNLESILAIQPKPASRIKLVEMTWSIDVRILAIHKHTQAIQYERNYDDSQP